MRLILPILFSTCVLARPQSGPPSGPPAGLTSGFKSADEDTEILSIEVLEKHENYEVRKIPATKWVCTKENKVDPLADPMRNWEEKYDNNPMLAMRSSNYKEGPSSKMFMKLFRYILGVNQEAVEIEMTRPVPTSVIPVENNLVDQEMCFWLGTPYESKEAPLAIDKKVTIEEKPALTFYVSQFNGYMFSHQDWESKYQNLKNILSAYDNINPDPNVWYHIGYDSPWTPADERRNEIWIPIAEAEDTNTV